MHSVTITVERKAGLVVPTSVRRLAGMKAGDQLEVKASRGVITIVSKPDNASEEYTAAQRKVIGREIAKGLVDVRKGRVHGPLDAAEMAHFLKAELKARAKKSKPK
jgi:bifunctional DNA-binding transcriptional regulator/antitoxin component of YhaV-PrlF toxin-antitoxin module